jgi:hypothetical protein
MSLYIILINLKGRLYQHKICSHCRNTDRSSKYSLPSWSITDRARIASFAVREFRFYNGGSNTPTLTESFETLNTTIWTVRNNSQVSSSNVAIESENLLLRVRRTVLSPTETITANSCFTSNQHWVLYTGNGGRAQRNWTNPGLHLQISDGGEYTYSVQLYQQLPLNSLSLHKAVLSIRSLYGTRRVLMRMDGDDDVSVLFVCLSWLLFRVSTKAEDSHSG